MFAKGALDGGRLNFVAQGRRSSVRVDIAHLVRFEARIAQGVAHHAEASIAVFGRLRNVIGVGAHTIADYFGDDPGASVLCVFQLFQDEDSRALADYEPVAVLVPGTAGVMGMVVSRR